MSASNPLVLGKEKEQKRFCVCARKRHPGTAFWVFKEKCSRELEKRLILISVCYVMHLCMSMTKNRCFPNILKICIVKKKTSGLPTLDMHTL